MLSDLEIKQQYEILEALKQGKTQKPKEINH